jgi:hypothetical protein
LFGLPETAPGLLCGTPTLAVGVREFQAKVPLDLSLVPRSSARRVQHVATAHAGDLGFEGRFLPLRHHAAHHRHPLERLDLLRPEEPARWGVSRRQKNGAALPALPASVRKLRCAVYTRKSTEEGLDQAFNSLGAQRDACEA